MAHSIRTYRELNVYSHALDAAMTIFQITRSFPTEEKYSMVDQMRRSSRSVCTNIAEAWRKRRYRAAFIAKLNDAESEAAETQVWLELALKCGYLTSDTVHTLDAAYNQILSQLVRMINGADAWLIKSG